MPPVRPSARGARHHPVAAAARLAERRRLLRCGRVLGLQPRCPRHGRPVRPRLPRGARQPRRAPVSVELEIIRCGSGPQDARGHGQGRREASRHNNRVGGARKHPRAPTASILAAVADIASTRHRGALRMGACETHHDMSMTCGMHTPAHTAMDECVGQSDRMSVRNEFNCVMCSSATPTALLSLISKDPMFKTRPDCAVTRCSLTITCQTGECVSASADSASMLPSCGKLSMVAHDSRSNSIVTILNQQRTAGDSPSWAEA